MFGVPEEITLSGTSATAIVSALAAAFFFWPRIQGAVSIAWKAIQNGIGSTTGPVIDDGKPCQISTVHTLTLDGQVLTFGPDRIADIQAQLDSIKGVRHEP